MTDTGYAGRFDLGRFDYARFDTDIGAEVGYVRFDGQTFTNDSYAMVAFT